MYNYIVTFTAINGGISTISNIIIQDSPKDVNTVFAEIVKQYNPECILIIRNYEFVLQWSREKGITFRV